MKLWERPRRPTFGLEVKYYWIFILPHRDLGGVIVGDYSVYLPLLQDL